MSLVHNTPNRDIGELLQCRLTEEESYSSEVFESGRATLPPENNSTSEHPNLAEAKEKESVRDALIRLVSESGCELFHDANLRTYVTVPFSGHYETWRLRSEGFRR